MQQPVLVETTGLVFKGDFPGAQTKEVLQAIGLNSFCDMVQDEAVTAKTVLAYCDGLGCQLFEGAVEGAVVKVGKPYGFGWDCIFRPKGSPRTFAMLPAEQKTMRTQALQEFVTSFNLQSCGTCTKE